MSTGTSHVLRAVAAALLLVAALVGPTTAGGPITITFWHGMSGVLQAPLNELTEDFNKLNPGIVVQAQYQGSYGTLNQKLIAAVAAGNPPTISQVYANWTSVLRKANAVVPIERFIRGPDGLSADEFNDILPPLRRANTWDGVMWTMPFNKSLHLVFYNADLFKEQNVKVPQTWDEFIATAKALTKEEGGRVVRYGFVIRPTIEYFVNMMLANGGDFYKTGGKEFAFNSREGVEAMQFLVDLVYTHKVAYIIPGFPDAELAAGKVAMYFATNPALAFAKAAVAGKFTVGVAPLPYKKKRATLLQGTDLAIMAKTTPEQQSAAWKYIKFLTGTTATTRWSLKTNYMPIRRSAINSTLMQVHLRNNPEQRAGLDALADARVDPSIAEWEEIRNIVADAVEQALLGKKTPQQALDEATAKANRVIAESK